MKSPNTNVHATPKETTPVRIWHTGVVFSVSGYLATGATRGAEATQTKRK